MHKKIFNSLMVVTFILVIIIGGNSYAYNYSFISVWNERISYDPAYFVGGTNNNITAGVIISSFVGDPSTLTHQVQWPPTNSEIIPYRVLFNGNPAYSKIIGPNVSSFAAWENITYDFSELGGGTPQPTDVFIPTGRFTELPTPTVTSYDSSTYTIMWDNSYNETDIDNFRVRIYSSLNADDFLFDSPSLPWSASSYTFADQAARDLLDAGAILGIEARSFQSSTELANTSIYFTQTQAVPLPTTLLLLGSGLVGIAELRRRRKK